MRRIRIVLDDEGFLKSKVERINSLLILALHALYNFAHDHEGSRLFVSERKKKGSRLLIITKVKVLISLFNQLYFTFGPTQPVDSYFY